MGLHGVSVVRDCSLRHTAIILITSAMPAYKRSSQLGLLAADILSQKSGQRGLGDFHLSKQSFLLPSCMKFCFFIYFTLPGGLREGMEYIGWGRVG